MKTHSWSDTQISVAKVMALIIPNDFLFTVFFLASKWGKPVTALKLAKELGAKEIFIRDHLNLLVKLGCARIEGKRYALSELGKQGITFLHEAVSKKQSHSASLSVTEFSKIRVGEVASATSKKTSLLLVRQASRGSTGIPAVRHIKDPSGGPTAVTSTEVTPNAA